MRIEKAKQEKIKDIVQISERAFESDVFVGGVEKDSPPDYDSVEWHEKMLEGNHLFQAMVEDTIVGGAILFLDEIGTKLYVGRIFIDDKYHRKGYGKALMESVEEIYPTVKEVHLDTPVWNVRTNSFYRKSGYVMEKQEEGFIFYKKVLSR